MKRNRTAAVLITAFLYLLTACGISPSGSLDDTIPTNASTNSVWGGKMCQGNGSLYYVAASPSEDCQYKYIMRMNEDGSGQARITRGYESIGRLAANDDTLYFDAATPDGRAIYRLNPNEQGTEAPLLEGNIAQLQLANNRLYWVDTPTMPTGSVDTARTKPLAIKSARLDGMDETVLLSMDVPAYLFGFCFLAAADGLYYYFEDVQSHTYNVYRMDFDGQNKTKLNQTALDDIFHLF